MRMEISIDQLWLEMETEPVHAMSTLWKHRMAHPQTGEKLLAGLEVRGWSRVLLTPACGNVLPSRRDWPECRGLELMLIALDSQPYFCVKLRDNNCADVFTALAEDVLRRLISNTDDIHPVLVLLDRLGQWQRFLSVSREYLSEESQRGLWGELHLLRTHLIPNFGAAFSIEAWKGCQSSHQDFQFDCGAVEVKTTAAKQPQNIRISSERQLDDTGVNFLCLYVVAIDEREISGEMQAQEGQSLADLVEEIRSKLVDNPTSLRLFNDKLFNLGWIDSKEEFYQTPVRTPRWERFFHVGATFPRLVEIDLPAGIGDVSYSLSLAACDTFAIPKETMLSGIFGTKN